MKQFLIRGTLAILPLAICIWLVWSIVVTLDKLGGAIFEVIGIDRPWPITGFLLIFLTVLGLGMAFSISFFRWLFQALEGQIMRFPILRTVYGSIKDLSSLLEQGTGHKERKQPVLVRQSDGNFIIGFVTSYTLPKPLQEALPSHEEDPWVPVLFQISYQVAGITLLVRQSDLIEVDWSFNEAMTYMITAGITGAKQPPQ